MLGFAKARQVRVDGRDRGTLVAQVDLDLAKVLALLQKMGRVRMAQAMDMSLLFHSTGAERDSEGVLESGAMQRLGGGGCAPSIVPFAWKEQRGMAMGFPLLPQQLQCALGQRHVSVLVALAVADVEEPALRINIANLEVQAFAQAQAAGVDGGQADALVEQGDPAQDVPDFPGRENHGKFELGVGADQLNLRRPGPLEGFFPKELDRAYSLSAGLASELPFGLKMEEVLAEFLRADQVRGFLEELTEFAQAVPVEQDGAFGQGQKPQVVEEAI